MKRTRYTTDTKKNIILSYIKKNSLATYKSIRKETKLHPERIFNSLEDAFKEAGIKPPRTFKIKTKEEKRKIIIDYIKRHPKTGGQTIAKDTKINPSNLFKNIEEAYKIAGINYPRKDFLRLKKRPREKIKEEILKLIKENPLVSISEITTKVKTNPYRIFKNFNELYMEAGISKIRGHDKRKIKKRREIINFIKQNSLATQREINKNCRTHVQKIFNGGIIEAYKMAGIKFPFERLKLYGVGLKEIRNRAKRFEDEIAVILSGYGIVNRLVKTKRGFADIVFERKGQKAIIEVKDYRKKEISISQINQLNKYLEDFNCTTGFLICHNKPEKDSFLMNKNKIFILNREDLDKIPCLISGSIG